jgi:hypothetical protein
MLSEEKAEDTDFDGSPLPEDFTEVRKCLDKWPRILDLVKIVFQPQSKII